MGALEFRNRIVVFIDILGFGALVEKAALDPHGKASYSIAEALKTIQGMTAEGGNDVGPLRNADPHIQIFSDSFILSVEANENSTKSLFIELGRLFVRLMKLGIWIRGGIAYGKISTDQHSPCGPAVNAAYRMESQIAKFPRIVLSAAMVDFCKTQATGILDSSYCERDEDGVFVVASLKMATENLAEFGIDIRDSADEIRFQLEEALEQIVDRPEHYAKISKLAELWNGIADKKLGFFSESFRTKGYVDFVDLIDSKLNDGLTIDGGTF